jgi:iduronate 2-sulfatase
VDAPEGEIWTDLHRYEARYDAEIAFADAQVGRVLDALDRLGLTDRTVVLLTSDHGEAIGERYHLLDHGGGIGDEEIRVPLVLRLPGRRHAGERFHGQVQTIDIMPTLAALAEAPLPAPVNGIDLLAALRQGGDPHPEAHVETRVIRNRWRDRAYDLRRDDTLKALRRPSAKLVVFPGEPRNYLELYDLEADPLETADIFHLRPEAAAELVESFNRFEETPPPRWNETADPEADSETRQIFCTLGYAECE